MLSAALVFSLMATGVGDPPRVDARAVFSLFKSHSSSFDDVTFLYEGTGPLPGGAPPGLGSGPKFQGLYSYRKDGATLLDVFGFGGANRPNSRLIFSLVHDQLNVLEATPDALPRVRDRKPETSSGGPGSLNRPNAPERIFLDWYFRDLEDPAEYDFESLGWEDVDSHRCLKARMLRHPKPRLKSWRGGLPLIKLWIDLERGGYPLRLEHYRGDDLTMRTEILRLERVAIPGGQTLWFPAEGKTATYAGEIIKGQVVYKKEPAFFETHRILTYTLKFNQGLSDDYFSVKRHALVANDEGLRKLQRELDRTPVAKVKPPPSDPESLKKRLDAALAEADSQASRLEASSPARAGVGWVGVLSWGLGVFGMLALGGASYWFWRNR